jgi:pyruvate dehydrogenase E2 component (dihydrolipoamide acetyltransferase)
MARAAIYMPKYGMTMTEGIITEWHVQEGETVQEGDALLTVETEKVDTQIEAPVSGTLVEVRYAEDAEVPVGEIIAYIEY